MQRMGAIKNTRRFTFATADGNAVVMADSATPDATATVAFCSTPGAADIVVTALVNTTPANHRDLWYTLRYGR